MTRVLFTLDLIFSVKCFAKALATSKGSTFWAVVQQLVKTGLNWIFHSYLEVSITALLVRHWHIKLVKSQSDSLQILLVLHPIDKISAYNVGLKKKIHGVSLVKTIFGNFTPHFFLAKITSHFIFSPSTSFKVLKPTKLGFFQAENLKKNLKINLETHTPS